MLKVFAFHFCHKKSRFLLVPPEEIFVATPLMRLRFYHFLFLVAAISFLLAFIAYTYYLSVHQILSCCLCLRLINLLS